MSVRKIKEQIRKEISYKLNNQAEKEVLQKSINIKAKLFSMPEFTGSKVVMLYASMDKEVATEKIIDEALRAGKRVALPFCAGQATIVPKEISDRQGDLRKGTYGIYEPKNRKENVQLGEIDLVVVPGVAFDKKNRRLGRGKGYYDKFLGSLPRNTFSVGLAFDFQIVENLPEATHDIPVSKVITN